MPTWRLGSNTYILLLLLSSVVIELPVEVSACVETIAKTIFLLLNYGLSVVFWGSVHDLPKQHQDAVCYFIHCSSIVWRLKVGFGDQREEKGE